MDINLGKPFRALKKTWQELLRRLGKKPEPPGYSYADRLVPVRRGPKGRSGAAVADPDE